MPISAVIWDFDGTILDTEWPAYVAAQREFERCGVELHFDEWQETIGTADHEPWWEVLRRRVGSLDDEQAMFTRHRRLKNELTDSAEPLPGVRELLDALADSGTPSAIASSSTYEWVERHCRRHGLWERFVAFATRSDVGAARTKPQPDLFLLAASRGGWRCDECLVIEDSKHGVEAARRAGMRVVAVPNRVTRGQDLSAADLVVDSLLDLDLDRARAW